MSAQDSSITEFLTFTVEITDNCGDEIVTPTDYGVYVYYIGDTDILYFSSYFTYSSSQCAVTYEAFHDSSYTTVIDPAIY